MGFVRKEEAVPEAAIERRLQFAHLRRGQPPVAMRQ